MRVIQSKFTNTNPQEISNSWARERRAGAGSAFALCTLLDPLRMDIEPSLVECFKTIRMALMVFVITFSYGTFLGLFFVNYLEYYDNKGTTFHPMPNIEYTKKTGCVISNANTNTYLSFFLSKKKIGNFLTFFL